MADYPSKSHNTVYQIMGVIMESVHSYRNDCRKKSHARKDCSKFSAWLARCKRCKQCKTDGPSDTGKLECASNWLGGQGSAATGGEEALRNAITNDSGVSPRPHRGTQKQGKAWQSLRTWKFNFLDRLFPPTLVSAMLEDFGFIAQYMGSIVGTMVAEEMNDWQLSLCCVRPLGSPRGRLRNKDGCDFATMGTDETTIPRDNITRERWETYTCGRHQDGQSHCFNNKLQMAVTVLDWQGAAANGLACIERAQGARWRWVDPDGYVYGCRNSFW